MESKGLLNMIMRGLQFLWALLVMALIGNYIARNNGHDPSIINYSMFCAVFAMLSLFYLIPSSLGKFVVHPALAFVLDLLNNLFWFCGAVALPSYLKCHSCSNRAYLNTNSITRGSSTLCREAQASTAFLWFGWAAFMASTVITGLEMGGSGIRTGGGIRRGPPAMSQV